MQPRLQIHAHHHHIMSTIGRSKLPQFMTVDIVHRNMKSGFKGQAACVVGQWVGGAGVAGVAGGAGVRVGWNVEAVGGKASLEDPQPPNKGISIPLQRTKEMCSWERRETYRSFLIHFPIPILPSCD